MENSLTQLISFSNSLKLLYVEDEDCSREQTIDILKMFFDDVTVCTNGKEACLKFDELKIDFIITDINMPKMNGIDFIKYVRQKDKDIPVFIFSAHSDTSFFLDSINLGVDGYLIKPINSKQFIDQIRKTVHKLYMQEKLKEYHETLEQKVQEQVDLLRQKDQLLLQQSKLAMMGEMMDIIAHQWKQPINIISMQSSLVYELRPDNFEELNKMVDVCHDKVKLQIEHILNTLDQFRAFFRPSEKISNISVKAIIEGVLVLIHDEIIKSKLKIYSDINENIKVNVNENEIKHIIINLINNSKDAYIINKIDDRQINISCEEDNEKVVLKVSDQAGGIPENILHKIFDANFTSKKQSGGTGMGLYMSKFIAQKNGGALRVENIQNGAAFFLTLQKG